MLKSIFRRIRQQPLFSAIYILGSALSIASAMIIVIYVYVNVADIYPERDRSHVYEVSDVSMTMTSQNGSTGAAGDLSYQLASRIADRLRPIATVSLEKKGFPLNKMINPADGSASFAVRPRWIDPEFFRINHFELLHGSYIDSVDLESRINNAVITDRLATRYFASPDSAVGRSICMGYCLYRVRGVVREPSFLMHNSYGQIFLPYTLIDNANSGFHFENDGMQAWNIVGSFTLHARITSDAGADSLMQIVDDVTRATEGIFTTSDRKCEITVARCGPLTSADIAPVARSMDWNRLMRKYGLIILILLVVPAINLGGMISGNMETRLAEMGVRKAFGAGCPRLLRSILAENMVLTGMGGVLGLAVSFLLVWQWRSWMFFSDDTILANAPLGVNLAVTPDMLFAPAVLGMAFLLCLLVNVMAAMLPAWWSLRRPIVESLSENK